MHWNLLKGHELVDCREWYHRKCSHVSSSTTFEANISVIIKQDLMNDLLFPHTGALLKSVTSQEAIQTSSLLDT